ncbi:MAG: hypothetical protein ACYDD1_23485, partial [Caulobacteraceae bacterium]
MQESLSRKTPGKVRALKLTGVLLGLGAPLGYAARASPAPALAEVRTDDVRLFYRIYDAANGAPTGLALQRDYIDAGSDGVRQFVPY